MTVQDSWRPDIYITGLSSHLQTLHGAHPPGGHLAARGASPGPPADRRAYRGFLFRCTRDPG